MKTKTKKQIIKKGEFTMKRTIIAMVLAFCLYSCEQTPLAPSQPTRNGAELTAYHDNGNTYVEICFDCGELHTDKGFRVTKTQGQHNAMCWNIETSSYENIDNHIGRYIKDLYGYLDGDNPEVFRLMLPKHQLGEGYVDFSDQPHGNRHYVKIQAGNSIILFAFKPLANGTWSVMVYEDDDCTDTMGASKIFGGRDNLEKSFGHTILSTGGMEVFWLTYPTENYNNRLTFVVTAKYLEAGENCLVKKNGDSWEVMVEKNWQTNLRLKNIEEFSGIEIK